MRARERLHKAGVGAVTVVICAATPEGKSLDLLYLHVPYSLSPFASLIFTQLLYAIFTLLMHISSSCIACFMQDLPELPQVLKETLQGKHSLLAAAALGNVQVVSEHIAKGADLGARNLRGQTALLLACLSAQKRSSKENSRRLQMRKHQAEEVAALLIAPTGAAGALDAVDNDGVSSLIAARRNGLDDIVKMLLKAGAKPEEEKEEEEEEEEE